MQQQKLRRYDWDFSTKAVPDNQLLPCVAWEYLRESETVRKLAKEYTAGNRDAADKAVGFHIRLDFPGHWDGAVFGTLVQFGKSFAADDSEAWQSLPAGARHSVNDYITRLPAAFWGGDQYLETLRERFAKHDPAKYYHLESPLFPALPEPFSFQYAGREIRFLVLDWNYGYCGRSQRGEDHRRRPLTTKENSRPISDWARKRKTARTPR